MKIEQTTTSITIPAGSYQVHVGAEHLYSHPRNHTATITENIPFSFTVNDIPYFIYDQDILEFDLTTTTSTTISMGESTNDCSFLTVGYKPITNTDENI